LYENATRTHAIVQGLITWQWRNHQTAIRRFS